MKDKEVDPTIFRESIYVIVGVVSSDYHSDNVEIQVNLTDNIKV